MFFQWKRLDIYHHRVLGTGVLYSNSLTPIFVDQRQQRWKKARVSNKEITLLVPTDTRIICQECHVCIVVSWYYPTIDSPRCSASSRVCVSIFTRFHLFFYSDVRGNPAVESQTSGAYTIIPQFSSPSQTVNIKIGETARLPCEVQNLGKSIKKASSIMPFKFEDLPVTRFIYRKVKPQFLPTWSFISWLMMKFNSVRVR